MTEPSNKSNRPDVTSHEDQKRNAQLSEEHLEMLIAAAGFETSEVDWEALTRIRELSAQAFEESAHCTLDRSTNEAPILPATPQLVSFEAAAASSGVFAMKTLLIAATVIIAMTIGWLATTPTQASLKLADVFESANQSKSLHLEVQRLNETAEVWIKDARLVRWENAPDEYQIARGSRLWRIHGSTDNAVVESQSKNPWQDESGNVDLLSLLDVPTEDRARLLTTTPDGFETFAGQSCLVFRDSIIQDGQRYRLQIYVDEANHDLLGMTLRKWSAPHNGPPIAEVSLLARNLPLDEATFRVPVNLAERDRIGKITDSQGLVALRPVGSQRWTPIARPTLLQTGDWVRTDVRGANAATLQMASDVKLIIGPGSLIELTTANEARLHSGTIQIELNEHAQNPFVVHGLNESQFLVQEPGKTLVRIDNQQQLTTVETTPAWLSGYAGTSAEDSIGSLIVEVDGRSTPLTVGEHHVTIEIRDQIARTTIEETFVNHTQNRLEGQFHFPLPQAASISGFGMWIGNELVEADIVEKQRAREIYETILREKRDPGLLEWTGGNIFKARVFPIEPHSEKRVKIVYTQVLPLQGDRYRYSYGLRSEMLQANPLRELNIRCLINSTVPLSGVESPTHTCRKQLTEHSAELEFVAQEYTPESDFEVVCDVSSRENDVIAIPHRRGDDGYFLLELMPPGVSGDWQRQTIGNGEPLEILLLCDTSGSMDSTMRKNQFEFVSAILGALGPNDKVAAATTDVTTEWIVENFTLPTVEIIEKIQSSLNERVSLGWTDLDQALEEVFTKVTPMTQVIYLGDGMVVTDQSDPAAFVNRANRKFAQAFRSVSEQPDFHAVSVGNSFESIVLKGLASLGHGSVREISGEKTPQLAALELLQELTLPGLKDVQVEFRGLQVAAVYPETLPNIPVGTQQILVGRYLPTEKNQRGEVIVTGTLEGKPVRYAAKIELEAAEAGNSFIPRLWARAHLDHLLQQGSSQQIQDQIIALSEEFHIITPYTSLLVLESDEDRVRFGVQRRFEMRDGERFFADGRSNANYELKQQQMQLAGSWRIGLRRQILSQLSHLGRNVNVFQPARYDDFGLTQRGMRGTTIYAADELVQLNSVLEDTRGGTLSFDSGVNSSRTWEYHFANNVRFGRGEEILRQQTNEWTENGVVTGRHLDQLPAIEQQLELSLRESTESYFDRLSTEHSDFLPELRYKEARGLGVAQTRLFDSNGDGAELFDGTNASFHGVIDMMGEYANGPAVDQTLSLSSATRQFDADGEYYAGARIQFVDFDELPADGWGVNFSSPQNSSFLLTPKFNAGFEGVPVLGKRPYIVPESRGRRGGNAGSAVTQLIPNFQWVAPHHEISTDESKWPNDAVELSKSLLRNDELVLIDSGVRITRENQSWDDNFDRLVTNGRRTEWWSPKSWATLDHSPNENAVVNWRNEMVRGIYSKSLLLGQELKIDDKYEEGLPLRLPDYSLQPIHEFFRGYDASLEDAGDARSALLLAAPKNETRLRLTINTEKHVIEKYETLNKDEVVSTIEYRDFQLVANQWWATEIVTTQADTGDRVVSLITQDVDQLDVNAFAREVDELLADREQSLILDLPLPSVNMAKQAIRDRNADIQDCVLLILYYSNYQKWDQVFEQVRNLEELAGEKPGVRWLRVAIEKAAGRNEDARQRIVDFLNSWSKETAEGTPDANVGDLYLATHALSEVYPIIQWPPYGPLVESVKPIFERQSDREVSMRNWSQRWISVLDQTNRSADALELAEQMAEEQSGNAYLQTAYIARLSSASRRDDGYAYLLEQMRKDTHWAAHELTHLRDTYANMLESDSRHADLLAFLEEWLAVETKSTSVFARYISAMIMNDRIDDGEQIVRTWLALAEQPDDLSIQETSKLQAAIAFAFGNGHNFNRYYGMDRKWLPELYQTVRACIQIDHRRSLAESILNNNNFQDSDEGDRLRASILSWLLEDADVLPVERLKWYINSLSNRRLLVGTGDEMTIRQVTREEWQNVANQILTRWERAEDADLKNQLSEPLTTIYRLELADQYLPFLRRQVVESAEPYQVIYRRILFDHLLTLPWSEEIEAEAFRLWPTLAKSESKAEETRILVQRLYGLVDAMLANRVRAAAQRLQEETKFIELSRTDLAAKQSESMVAARTGLRERLLVTIDVLQTEHPELIPWLEMEAMWLRVLLAQNRDEILKSCWEVVGDEIPSVETDKELTIEELRAESLRSALRQRAFQMVLNLTVRQESTPEQIQQLLHFIESAIARADQNSDSINAKLEEFEEPIDLGAPWRQLKFHILVALDRSDELLEILQKWVNNEKNHVQWQRALAYLHAERGELQAAIDLFESMKKNGSLTAEDVQTLANWYLVVDERNQYDQSRKNRFKEMTLNNINSFLSQKSQQIRNGQAPREIDEETLLALQVSFDKAGNPESQFAIARDLYQLTGEFRVLEFVPKAILGKTQSVVYSALTYFRSSILNDVQKEATTDEMLHLLVQLRDDLKSGQVPRGADPNKRSLALDLRALDLLETMIQWKAALVLNQPGPHVEKAVAALQRAFQHDWQDDEFLAYAEFLHQLGAVNNSQNQHRLQPLADEQLRQMQELYAQTPANSGKRARIGKAWAYLLYYEYEQKQQGIDRLKFALDQFSVTTDGLVPYTERDLVMNYTDLLQGNGAYAAAEEYVIKHLNAARSDTWKRPYEDYLNRLYDSALRTGATVSLGSGAELLENYVDRLVALCSTGNDDRVREMLIRVADAYDFAISSPDNRFPEAKQKFLTFCQETFQELVTPRHRHSSQIINHFASTIYSRMNAIEAFAFLLDRYEDSPERLRFTSDDPWNRYGETLAMYREYAARDLNKSYAARMQVLELRFLAIILPELRTDLVNLSSRNRSVYHDDYSYFWKEQSEEFARVAEGILKEHDESPRTITFVADYLYRGLSRFQRAITVMENAHQRGLLDDSGILTLVQYQHEQKQYEKSIALLEPMVERSPDDMSLRVLLLRAYWNTKQLNNLDRFLAETDAHFHQAGRWQESNIIQLARICSEIERYQKSAEHFEAAIHLHQRTQPNRGIGNGTLSYYYRELSSVYLALKDTEKAVDAAASAVVSWGPTHQNRQEAVENLKTIISNAPDLDEFIRSVDDRAEASGEDSPLIRKAIGLALLNTRKFLAAKEQLSLALALSPYDREIHTALLQTFDALLDTESATRQLLTQIDFDRHNLALYKDLAQRSKENPLLAERAATSIVEAAPNEAENHQALAELRQQQGRLDESIKHWERVAELRKLEPTGLLGLARVQLDARHFDDAEESIKQLQQAAWPEHFNNAPHEIRDLDQALQRLRRD